MRFGSLPDTFGQVIAAQPWLLGFYPGRDRLGWLAADGGQVMAVGAAQAERAGSAAFARLFAREVEPHEVDTFFVIGAPGTLTQQESFAGHVARTGQRVYLAEVEANSFRRQGSAQWEQIPPPPMSVLLSGRPEPALSFEDLTSRYELLPGPQALEHAPVLSHVEKAAIDRLRPRSRFERAMAEVRDLALPAKAADPRAVARLGYLVGDPYVRGAVLHQVLPQADAVEALVSAHRVAHLDEGSELRGLVAMAVYTTAAVPTVADWVLVHAEDALLSQQVRHFIISKTPSDIPRSVIMGSGPMASLTDHDERWLSAQATPLTPSLTALQERLQRLQGPIEKGPELPPPGPVPPSPSGPQM